MIAVMVGKAGVEGLNSQKYCDRRTAYFRRGKIKNLPIYRWNHTNLLRLIIYYTLFVYL